MSCEQLRKPQPYIDTNRIQVRHNKYPNSERAARDGNKGKEEVLRARSTESPVLASESPRETVS